MFEAKDVAKTDGGLTPIVLKFEMHCEGCAKKVKRFVRKLEGVESVNADVATNKLTVIGKANPEMVRDKLAEKIRKTVELISLPPAKKSDAKNDGGGGDKKAGSKDASNCGDKKPDDKPDKKTDEKLDKKHDDKSIKKNDDHKGEDKNPKEKEAPTSTVVLSMRLHCERCIKKIKKFINSYKGVESVNIDDEKKIVTVKGKMDVKVLVPELKIKFKRLVNIVPSKDDGPVTVVITEKVVDKKEKGGGKKKNVPETTEKKDEAVQKKSPVVVAAVSGGGEGGAKMEVNKMEYYGYQQHQASYYYGGPEHVYGHAYMMETGPSQSQHYQPQSYVTEQYNVPSYDASQMFSDENPNGCFVM